MAVRLWQRHLPIEGVSRTKHALGLLLLVVGACSPSASTPDPGVNFGEAWKARLPEILAVASEAQRQVLADGVVESAEYERAFLAYRACIEAGGVIILSLERDDDGVIQGMAVGDGTSGDASVVVSRCDEEHFRYVAEGWRVGLHPGDSELQQLARVAHCLIDQGFDVPPNPRDNAELLAAMPGDDPAHKAYLDCVDSVQ